MKRRCRAQFLVMIPVMILALTLAKQKDGPVPLRRSPSGPPTPHRIAVVLVTAVALLAVSSAATWQLAALGGGFVAIGTGVLIARSVSRRTGPWEGGPGRNPPL